MKRIYEQEEIYNAIMAVIDEQDRTISKMEKDYSKKLTKKDNEIKKLREIIGSCGISAETLALKLKA